MRAARLCLFQADFTLDAFWTFRAANNALNGSQCAQVAEW